MGGGGVGGGGSIGAQLPDTFVFKKQYLLLGISSHKYLKDNYMGRL